MSRAHILAFSLAASCLVAAPAVAQSLNEPALIAQSVASGLSQPTSMAFLGPDDILVLQKADGRVRRVTGGVLQAAAVLDVAVDSNSERGLLGIALDPDFDVTRHVYLYYTESSTGLDTTGEANPLGNRIYQYDWNGSALVNPVLILDLPWSGGPNHDGGVIAFGPDGFLYAVIGDLNRSGKLQNISAGPDPDDTGVIARIDTTGRAVSGNPFFTPADPSARMNRYYAYGVRNSFGLTFDARTGRLWDTENGPGNYDEVNLVVSGFNSGWNRIMGPVARDPQGIADLWVAPGSVYRDPEFSWNIPVAPTALVFPESPRVGCALRDELLVGDNNCGQISRFKLNAARDALALTSAPLQDRVADNQLNRCFDEMAEIAFGQSFGAVTDLENGPDGLLYIVSISAGQIFRIGPRAGFFPDADGDGVNDACDCGTTDPFAYGVPGEIARQRILGVPPYTVFWDRQTGAAGPGTTTTIVSGPVSGLRASGGYAAACDLAAGVAGTSFNDPRPAPPIGEAYYYLVRGQNGCGQGTFGDGTPVPDPRDALDNGSRPGC
jgi:glucose/arabinose dehydrogenase